MSRRDSCLSEPSPDSPGSSNDSCELCDEITEHLYESESTSTYADVLLGTLDEIKASPCPVHKSLVESLQARLEDGSSAHDGQVSSSQPAFGPWSLSDRLEFQRVRSVVGARVTRLVVHRDSTGQMQMHDLILAKKEGARDHKGSGLILDKDWIDVERMRRWMAYCFENHGAACENPMKIARRPPRYLVDVKKRCIVDAGPQYRYFALSYRIGKPGQFHLRSENLEQLCQVDALRRPDILGSLQLTVRHAFCLAETLNADYLWVDVLCVMHDSPESIARQLNDMASIYSSALATIVVADGEGSDGISGLPGISPPRKLEQAIFEFRDERLLLRANDSVLAGGAYHQRAWTHQEFKMSPRKLILRSNQAHWICQRWRLHESLSLAAGLQVSLDLPKHILLDGIPDLDYLFRVVLSEYNKKALTYAEDSLSAALGLLAVFSRTFEGGFLYGLPEIFFDIALGWDPHPLTTKRQKLKSFGHISLGPSELPSWSWIGWDGPFRMKSTEPCEIASKQKPKPYRRINSSITEWYTSDKPEGSSLRKIDSSWCANRERFVDVGQPLPEGWTRTESKARDSPTQTIYRHERLHHWDGQPQYWKHPFHVPKIDSTTPFSYPLQTPYLFCKTWRASVWAERSVDPRRDFNDRMATNRLIVRRTRDGPMIGGLHLGAAEWHEFQGRDLDVVGIHKFEEFGGPVNRKMVKVLWVQWEDSIAYRRASGEVEEGSWEGMKLEGQAVNIDLVLG